MQRGAQRSDGERNPQLDLQASQLQCGAKILDIPTYCDPAQTTHDADNGDMSSL